MQEIYGYTEEEKEDFLAYIERNFGEIVTILHEKRSKRIHVDMVLVGPTKRIPYYRLITMGMGSYEMNIPDKYKEISYPRVELMAFLPQKWDFVFKEKWILDEFFRIANIQVRHNDWTGPFHIQAYDEELHPFSKNTKFAGGVLLPGYTNPTKEYKVDLRLRDKGKINFLLFMPLYREEILKLEDKGHLWLLDRLEKHNIPPVVNSHRKNVCKNEKIINR